MTDAAFVFNSTNAQRANVKRSACHKKTGKSKFVKLPSDHLSKKEKEKMNGPCETWKLTDFYTWEEFKLMPRDIQVLYINRLIETYDVGLENISKDLFNRSKGSLYQHLSSKLLLNSITKRPKGKHIKPMDIDRFQTDILMFWGEKETLKQNQEIINEEVKEEMTKQEAPEPITNVKMELEEPVEVASANEPTSITHQVFSTTYISDHIDLKQVETIAALFENGKNRMRVIFEVEVL